jgi:transglutaminase-like putative cysteine protease
METSPCRYVAGMMMGEGSSHAWVEVWDEEKWIGYDPTNKRLVDDDYIKISNGRDSADCLVNQGIFTGNVAQTQEISVIVEEVLDE